MAEPWGQMLGMLQMVKVQSFLFVPSTGNDGDVHVLVNQCSPDRF
jgi:hypothetical protein